ncbi:MAG: UDP-N-acetylmuramoyl-L-alanine--D-glutamate ligase [Treponema sp.]|jgi:UDP-N-acetylmuramoylalanine--D-glutamate ligase|nr:UDP-N-acetylmuramoyl-L-alanine--D-glutamate ligase [Treponema sp.]
MEYAGMKVLVMGLGLHGGGLESARYLARHGAEVTVTDLRDEKTLAPSIDKLEAGNSPEQPGKKERRHFRYVLGRHETADFERADMVIKNPGVRPDSPYLKAARRIETDISLFLRASPARLTAVTGSKGKSSTATALYRVLEEAHGKAALHGALHGKAWLGGNIAVSPLSFLDELGPEDDVVLELSSWQLGDLGAGDKGRLLKPRCAVLTAIMRDHQDRYGSMEAYVEDKRVIYRGQDKGDATVAGSDGWGLGFLAESRGRPLRYGEGALPEGTSGGWIDGGGLGFARFYEGPAASGALEGRIVEVVPERLLVPGRHQRMNLLAASLALLDLGLSPELVREALGSFPGIEHRLEFFHQAGGVRFYNDSAATIPEAAAAAVAAFRGEGGAGNVEPPPLVLVTGGTDKNLDFSPLVEAAGDLEGIILLAGSGSDKLKGLLAAQGVPFRGPFDRIDDAVQATLDAARPGSVAVLSPGCASFGMFLNEFDRGEKWKEAVRRMAN